MKSFVATLTLLPVLVDQAAGQLVCKGTPPGTDSWCNLNCNYVPAFCPSDLCSCAGGPSTAQTTAKPATTTSKSTSSTRPLSTASTSLRSSSSTSTQATSLRTTAAPVTTKAPTTAAPSPTGSVMGFWYGYAGSASPSRAPSTGWFFSFPGLLVDPPFTPGSGYIPSMPSWGSYSRRFFTQGGGDTYWGDALYTKLQAQLSAYKSAGWHGVCWDWEVVAADHTTTGFNALMRATKAAGLVNIVTSTATGPYDWRAANKDATGIDWTAVDYFAPQMYGADGTLSDPLWPTYAEYWVSGAGRPNIHGVTFGAIPLNKILWGMPYGTCNQATKYGGAGCVEWVYSPNVQR